MKLRESLLELFTRPDLKTAPLPESSLFMLTRPNCKKCGKKCMQNSKYCVDCLKCPVCGAGVNLDDIRCDNCNFPDGGNHK